MNPTPQEPAKPLTCQEVADFLADFVEGALPAAVRVVFEEHLRVCRPCVSYLQSYRTTIDVARLCLDEPEADAGQRFPDELVEAILKAREQSPE